MTSVLMVLTGANVWTMKDGTPHPTGFWAEEFIRPHRAFVEAGYEVTVATPHGVRPTVDPLSLAKDYYTDEQITEQKAYLHSVENLLSQPASLSDVDPDRLDVIFHVGGHGPMQDMAVDPTIGTIYGALLRDPKKVVAAVCHGPASFLSAHDKDGSWLFKGRKLTGFSNQEENMATFAGNAPWLLEDRLRRSGADYVADAAFSSHVVTDGNLVTGQNQNSAEAAAEAVIKLLSA